MDINIILTATFTIIAAIIGALLSRWFLRSKIWLNITSIDQDDTVLIDLSPEIIKLSHTSHYRTVQLSGSQVPLHEVISTYTNSSVVLKLLKESLDKLNDFDKKLDNKTVGQEDKIKDLTELFSDNLINQILEGKISNGTLPLPDKLDIDVSTMPLVVSEEFTKPENQTKGLIVYGKQNSFSIRLGDGLIGNVVLNRTRIFNQIIQYFVEPYIKKVINTIIEEIKSDIHIIYDLNEKLKELLHSQRLKVKVKISNTGGTPVNISPFSILKINSGGKAINPILISAQNYRSYEAGVEDLPRMMQIMEGMAKKQGVKSIRTPSTEKHIPEYIVIKPGDLVDVELISIDPIEDRSIITALESGILSSQVIMKRADSVLNKVIKSEYQTMGLKINPDTRKDLLKLAND